MAGADKGGGGRCCALGSPRGHACAIAAAQAAAAGDKGGDGAPPGPAWLRRWRRTGIQPPCQHRGPRWPLSHGGGPGVAMVPRGCWWVPRAGLGEVGDAPVPAQQPGGRSSTRSAPQGQAQALCPATPRLGDGVSS